MSASDDERRRLEKRYRDLPASELLRLYETRDGGVSEAMMELLRGELRLRGLDPDSLRPTVPKAQVEGEGGGDASLADDEPSRGEAAAPPPLRESSDPSDADAAASAAADPPPVAGGQKVRCLQCNAINSAVEVDCQRCGSPLGEPERHQTMKRRITDPGLPLAPKPSGTVASATLGTAGVLGVVVGCYALTLPAATTAFALTALMLGLLNLAIARALYHQARRRREAEEADDAAMS